jgi:prolyl 4-hydroxylase
MKAKVLVCCLLLTLLTGRSTIIPVTYGSIIDANIITEEEEKDGTPHSQEQGSCSATDADGTCIETSPTIGVSPDIINSDDNIIIEAEKRRMKYESCTNRDEACASYATDGGCTTNPGYMWYHCGSACGTCDAVIDYISSLELVKDDTTNNENKLPCADDDYQCNSWANVGECTANPSYMTKSCRYSCKVCHDGTNKFGIAQRTHNSDTNTIARITQSIQYMELVYNNEIYQKVRQGCKNLHEDCSLWASLGECTNNPGYMELNCAPACMCCDKLDINARCPILPDNPIIWKAGDLNTMMERIVDDVDGTGEYLRYNPQALSRPVLKRDGTPAPVIMKDGPWVVLLENFVSNEEADRLVELGKQQGYERSAGVGKPKHDGTHDATVDYSRTSHNTWCEEPSCYEDPLVSPVVARIANITRTKNENAEYLQMLQYEPGQYYRQHHDYIEHHKGLPCGVRILTLFIYLNDVEEGGGTKFNVLDITVQPKKGSAVLWPSVLDESPEDKDARTDHEALPVIKGVKYGANAWIHNRNYKEAYAHNCQ